MSKGIKAWLMLTVLACIWGSSFILMKKGMFARDGSAIFSDSQVGALRMLIAACVLLPFALSSVRKIKTMKQFLLLGTVGMSGNFFPAFLFTYAETSLSSGFAGMLNSFTPIFTIVIGFFIYKIRLSSLQLIGVAVGSVGIVLLMIVGKNLSMTGTWDHVLAIVFATFFYAISLTTIKYKLQDFKSFEITSLAFLIILLPSIIANIQFGTLYTLQKNPNALEGLGFISILAIIGTALAVILFNQLISTSSALFASSVTYFIPIVAVLFGMSYGEKIEWNQVESMMLVLLGVFIANYGNQLEYFKKK